MHCASALREVEPSERTLRPDVPNRSHGLPRRSDPASRRIRPTASGRSSRGTAEGWRADRGPAQEPAPCGGGRFHPATPLRIRIRGTRMESSRSARLGRPPRSYGRGGQVAMHLKRVRRGVWRIHRGQRPGTHLHCISQTSPLRCLATLVPRKRTPGFPSTTDTVGEFVQGLVDRGWSLRWGPQDRHRAVSAVRTGSRALDRPSRSRASWITANGLAADAFAARRRDGVVASPRTTLLGKNEQQPISMINANVHIPRQAPIPKWSTTAPASISGRQRGRQMRKGKEISQRTDTVGGEVQEVRMPGQPRHVG